MIGSSGSRAASDGRLASQACRSALLRWISPRYSPLAAMVVSSSFRGRAYGRIGEQGMRICVFGAGAIGGEFSARPPGGGAEGFLLVGGGALDAVPPQGPPPPPGRQKGGAPGADSSPPPRPRSTRCATGIH